MLSERTLHFEDDTCPVPEKLLGEMYRANTRELGELIATVPPAARALLAVYCYRRAHLASIGIAIAATCEKDDLGSFGGNTGIALFERSREPLQRSFESDASKRKMVTLSDRTTFQLTGPLRHG